MTVARAFASCPRCGWWMFVNAVACAGCVDEDSERRLRERERRHRRVRDVTVERDSAGNPVRLFLGRWEP